MIKAKEIRDNVWDIYYSYVHLIVSKIQYHKVSNFITNFGDVSLGEENWDMPLWNTIVIALRDGKFYDK